MSSYENNGIKVMINEDPFSVVICTPLMQRAHTLSYSKDIVFVDSTASCDAHNHSITFMLILTLNRENNIDKSDSPILYNYFRKIFTAPTAEMAISAYLIAIDISNEYVLKYPNWVKYLSSYWSRKEIWCFF